MNEDDARRLFESVEAPDEPPLAVRERVRGVVRGAWLDLPTKRGRGTRAAACGVAAGVVVAALVAWLVWMPELAAPAAIAGHVEYATGGHVVVGNGDLDAPRLAQGATVETASAGRMLLRLRDGARLRLDAATRLTLRSAAELGLERGRLFVDSMGSDIAVTTGSGLRVENVGTQFEVAVDGDRVDVAVREGRVDARAGAQSIRAEAREGIGEAVTFEGSNVVTRSPVLATGPRWDWIHASMPPFELDGATVFAFLAWAAAEGGMVLEFADEAVFRQARTVRLHGPPVPPERIDREEITTTLQTAPSFRILQSKGHRLLVGRPDDVASGRQGV